MSTFALAHLGAPKVFRDVEFYGEVLRRLVETAVELSTVQYDVPRCRPPVAAWRGRLGHGRGGCMYTSLCPCWLGCFLVGWACWLGCLLAGLAGCLGLTLHQRGRRQRSELRAGMGLRRAPRRGRRRRQVGAVGAVGEGGVAAAEGVAACGAARTRLGCTHRTRGAVRSACLRREGTFGRKGRSGPCSAAYVSKYGGDIICAWDARTNLTCHIWVRLPGPWCCWVGPT